MKNAELILGLAIEIQDSFKNQPQALAVVSTLENVNSLETANEIADQLKKVLGLSVRVQMKPHDESTYFLVTSKGQKLNQKFIDLMESQLNVNSHKGNWEVYAKANNFEVHIERMKKKIEKIESTPIEDIDVQFADLANIAMFAFTYE